MKAAAPALLPLLRSQAQGEMLTLLFLNPDDEFSLSDIARITGSSLTTIHSEVSRMVQAGLVRDRRIGNIRLVSADTGTPLAAPLLALLMATYGPPTVLGEELATMPGIDLAYLHGAWAERHAGRHGTMPEDLQLLVVGTVPEEVLSSAVTRASAVLLRPIETTQVSGVEWSAAREAESASSWLADVASGPLVPVDLTRGDRAGSRTPRSAFGSRQEFPAAAPAPGDNAHEDRLPPQGPEAISPALTTTVPSPSTSATPPHRPVCPLLVHVPFIGERLQQWDLPQLPAPAVPSIVTRVSGGIVDVASLTWLPWHALPIHVHLGPCRPDSAGR